MGIVCFSLAGEDNTDGESVFGVTSHFLKTLAGEEAADQEPAFVFFILDGDDSSFCVSEPTNYSIFFSF